MFYSLCVSCSPLQLSAPQDVLLPIHQHREMLVFPLFDGVRASSDRTHLPKLWNIKYTVKQNQQEELERFPRVTMCSDLCNSAMIQAFLQVQPVHPRGTKRPETEGLDVVLYNLHLFLCRNFRQCQQHQAHTWSDLTPSHRRGSWISEWGRALLGFPLVCLDSLAWIFVFSHAVHPGNV